MNKLLVLLVAVSLSTVALAGDAARQGDVKKPSSSQAGAGGIRGESAAIADAEAMVNTMGGMTIWARLKSMHFVHEWYPWHRVDSYVENEILDLAGPRSRTDRKSEISHTIRAYSPEGKRWDVDNGRFEYAGEDALQADLKRAPFNFYRLVRAIAVGDPYL